MEADWGGAVGMGHVLHVFAGRLNCVFSHQNTEHDSEEGP